MIIPASASIYSVPVKVQNNYLKNRNSVRPERYMLLISRYAVCIMKRLYNHPIYTKMRNLPH